MTNHLPSVRQIDRAKPCLRQALDIASMIEGMEGYAPISVVDRHRQQFLFQMERAAAALGISKPVSLVIDNTNHAEAGPR